MKNKKIFIFLSIIFLLISIVILINVIKNKNKSCQSILEYKLVDSKIKNNTAIVDFEVKVIKGEKIDPIKNIHIVEENNLILYPLNGYPKIQMKEGETKYFSFCFHFPNKQKNILEIISSNGQKKIINLNFPEVANREKTLTIDNNLIGIGEGLTVSNEEKYSVNHYKFIQFFEKNLADNLTYLIINMTIENISQNKTIRLFSEYFSLSNKDGNIIYAEGKSIKDRLNHKKEFIVPGEKVSMEIYFIVSKYEKEFFLNFKKHKVFTIIKTIDLK